MTPDALRHALSPSIASQHESGNIGGELLNWIAMLGVIGDRKPRFIHAQADGNHGQAFGAWRWD